MVLVRFFHFVPAKSSEGEAQPQVPVHVGALVLLSLHGVEELQLLPVGLHVRLRPAVRQVGLQTTLHRVAGYHQAAGFLWFVVRDSREALRLEQRLVVDHDELALVRLAAPLQKDPCALVAQQTQLRAAVGGRAVVGNVEACSQGARKHVPDRGEVPRVGRVVDRQGAAGYPGGQPTARSAQAMRIIRR